MKKIISIFAIAFSMSLNAQNITPVYSPYAMHDFGIDSITGLDKQIKIIDFDCNAISRRIVVTYEVVLKTRNDSSGVFLQCYTDRYIIDDSTPSLNYTNYWNSAIGIAIRADFASDLNRINSYTTFRDSLQQR